MMLNVTLKLDRMHCHRASDHSTSSEPYLWTVFFYADINTIYLGAGNRIATYTPHWDWTTRGLYRDGVDDGEDVDIPESMGSHNFILDDGNTGNGVAGNLFVLLEQDSSPGDAIRAGHKALAEATDAALNAYVDSKFPIVVKPTEDEVQIIADQIKGEVIGAIRDNLNWYQYLNNQDDFLGFGYQIYTFSELNSLALEANPVLSFSNRITEVLSLNPAVILNDYEIFGSVQVQSLNPPLDWNRDALVIYESAVENLQAIDMEIQETIALLEKASDTERKDILARLKFLQRTVQQSAIKSIGSTRSAYNESRDRYNKDTARYLESKKELRSARAKRISNLKPNLFPETANVAPPQTDPAVQ